MEIIHVKRMSSPTTLTTVQSKHLKKKLLMIPGTQIPQLLAQYTGFTVSHISGTSYLASCCTLGIPISLELTSGGFSNAQSLRGRKLLVTIQAILMLPKPELRP